MSELFKIWIDRLKGGRTQKIEESLDPAFLGPEEEELHFRSKVDIKGEAYLTDAHLIVHLKARCQALMPCSICNEMIQVELKNDNFYHTQPIEEIAGAVFDFSELLREALLLELPKAVECNKGNCAQRATMAPYLRAEKRKEKTTYFPFAHLDDNEEKK